MNGARVGKALLLRPEEPFDDRLGTRPMIAGKLLSFLKLEASPMDAPAQR